MGMDEAVVPAVVRRVPAVVRRVLAVVRRVLAVVRRVLAAVRRVLAAVCWVPAVVRQLLAAVCWVPAVVPQVLAAVCWVPAVVRRVLAAVCWVQQLSHEDQKHHKGKTRNFYLKFLLSFPLFFLLSLIPVLFYLGKEREYEVIFSREFFRVSLQAAETGRCRQDGGRRNRSYRRPG
jgi:hypothetical protein